MRSLFFKHYFGVAFIYAKNGPVFQVWAQCSLWKLFIVGVVLMLVAGRCAFCFSFCGTFIFYSNLFGGNFGFICLRQ